MTIKIIEDQTPEIDMVVCKRVEDVPIPYHAGAMIQHCSTCQERIWVTPTSPEEPRKVCYQCAVIEVEVGGKEPTIYITRNTAAQGGKARMRELATLLEAGMNGVTDAEQEEVKNGVVDEEQGKE